MLQDEVIRIAWENLWSNKLRSFLTLLGIAIGIGATISLVGIGFGFKTSIMKQFQNIGTNTIMVFPNALPENGKNPALITEKDWSAIQEVCGDDISNLILFINTQTTVYYRNKQSIPLIIGTSVDFPLVQNLHLKYGRFLSREDLAVGRRVVVVDWKVSEKLFGNLNPVGKMIYIFNRPFKVVGCLAQKDGISFAGSNNGFNVYMPITVLQRILQFPGYHGLYIVVSNLNRTPVLVEKITGLMAKRYGPKNGFNIIDTKQFLDAVLVSMNIITTLLGMIGGIALIVSGIGIMNIMLVSVTERIREIGIRKALGAKQRHILSQFLTESIFLCLIGGLFGVGMAYLAIDIIRRISPLQPLITPGLVILAFLFASITGLFFGVFPAWKAAKLDPIEALRHE